MKAHTTAEEMLLGSQSVDHDMESLSLAVHLPGQASHREQNLDDVQSKTRILRRHLDRLFHLEEIENYLDFLTEARPELGGQVAQLRAEHAEFRRAFNSLLERLDALGPNDLAAFDAICTDIHQVLRRILEHGRAEGELLAQGLESQQGGEG